jgi:hypothetical protein
MSTNTSHYNFYLPSAGDGRLNSHSWGDRINQNFTDIDNLLYNGVNYANTSRVGSITRPMDERVGEHISAFDFGAIANDTFNWLKDTTSWGGYNTTGWTTAQWQAVFPNCSFTGTIAVEQIWTANTAYGIGARVFNSDNTYYQCTTAHTSSTTFDGSKWSSYSPAWVASHTTYAMGNRVVNGTDVYVCTRAHVAGSNTGAGEIVDFPTALAGKYWMLSGSRLTLTSDITGVIGGGMTLYVNGTTTGKEISHFCSGIRGKSGSTYQLSGMPTTIANVSMTAYTVNDVNTNCLDYCAVQSAIYAAEAGNNMAQYGPNSPALGCMTVFCPSGFYVFHKELTVWSKVEICGEQYAETSGATRFLASVDSKDTIKVNPQYSGMSFVIRNIAFWSFSGTGWNIHVGVNPNTGANANSSRVDRCMFFNSTGGSMWIEGGDEGSYTNCTIDCSTYGVGIRLGDNYDLAHTVSNCVFDNWHFFDMNHACFEFRSAWAVQINNCILSEDPSWMASLYYCPSFCDATTVNPYTLRDISITNCLFPARLGNVWKSGLCLMDNGAGVAHDGVDGLTIMNCQGQKLGLLPPVTTNWVTGKAYAVGDKIRNHAYEDANSLSGWTIYSVPAGKAHTSGTFATDLASGNWVVDTIQWQTGKTYFPGDRCINPAVSTTLVYGVPVGKGHVAGTFATDLSNGNMAVDSSQVALIQLAGYCRRVIVQNNHFFGQTGNSQFFFSSDSCKHYAITDNTFYNSGTSLSSAITGINGLPGICRNNNITGFSVNCISQKIIIPDVTALTWYKSSDNSVVNTTIPTGLAYYIKVPVSNVYINDMVYWNYAGSASYPYSTAAIQHPVAIADGDYVRFYWTNSTAGSITIPALALAFKTEK